MSSQSPNLYQAFEALAEHLQHPLRIPLLALALIGVIGLTGCDEIQQDATVIKLAHGMDPTHPVSKSMQYMAEQVAERSNGAMRVDIYPNSQLGAERELLELLQIGSLGMTKTSSAALEGFVPAYKALGVPYLFRDKEHFFKALSGKPGRRILLSGQDNFLRGLVFYDAGSRSFYTKEEPIRSPEDLRGKKIRTMNSPMAMQMIQVMGGSATPISYGELYTALQQGVVDGAENNPPSFHSARHYEVTGYYSLDEHTAVPDVLLVSTHVWNDLTDQEQEWLQAAADASAQYHKELWAQAEKEALEVVKEAGIEVIEPDKEPFVEAVQPIYESFKNSSNPSDTLIYSLIEQIQAVE